MIPVFLTPVLYIYVYIAFCLFPARWRSEYRDSYLSEATCAPYTWVHRSQCSSSSSGRSSSSRDADLDHSIKTVVVPEEHPQKTTRTNRTMYLDVCLAIDNPMRNYARTTKSHLISLRARTRYTFLRPLLTGCTSYRIYMTNWCIPSKTIRYIPLKD